jgi:TolA-binding protein
MLGAITTIAFFFMLTGCGGSEEATKEGAVPPSPSATEMMQKELGTLQGQNDSLRQEVKSLEQQSRSANARTAELETQLNETREKLAAATAPPPKPTIENPSESYRQALQLFNQREYQKAADLFQACLDDGIAPERRDNCEYWIGECDYGLKKYNDAIAHFTKVFDYKITEKRDESQVMIANCYYAMGDKMKAREAYERLIKVFPASPYVNFAKERLAKL